MAVTVDLRFLPDLEDLPCCREVRPPSVAHTWPSAAAGRRMPRPRSPAQRVQGTGRYLPVPA